MIGSLLFATDLPGGGWHHNNSPAMWLDVCADHSPSTPFNITAVKLLFFLLGVSPTILGGEQRLADYHHQQQQQPHQHRYVSLLPSTAEAHPVFVPPRYLTSHIPSRPTIGRLHRTCNYHIPPISVATMVRSKFKDEHPFGESAFCLSPRRRMPGNVPRTRVSVC